MTLSDQERQVCGWIAARDAALRSTLAEHVAIPTGKNHQPGLTKYRTILAERLQRLGAAVSMLKGDPRPWWLDSTAPRRPGEGGEDAAPSAEDSSGDGSSGGAPVLIARHPGQSSTSTSPRILLVGHLDTVHDPEGSFREMTIEPSGDRATGPGVVDMKGGVLVMLTALESLRAADIDLPWTVLLNSDEETGSFQSARRLRETAAEHDLGFVVEPALSDGSLAIQRMGSGQFMIEVFGQSAHVGREFEKGLSAVTKLGELLIQLARMARPEEGRIVNVGPLRGGTVTNAVPDYAACWGNVRYRDPETGEVLGRMIDDLATAVDALPRVAVYRDWNRPAKPLNDAVQALADRASAAAADLGQSLPFAKTGGVCDGNILQGAGLPTIDTLGVRGGNLHRPDEFIELASLVERSQLLAVLLMRLAGANRD